MKFPEYRMRRLRKTHALRELVRENEILLRQLIQPLFIIHGEGVKREIPSMPGIYNFSLDMLEVELKELSDLGIRNLLLFGIPAEKDHMGSDATNDNGIIQQAVRLIKQKTPEMTIITDVCYCEYTDHGHCGFVTKTGEVDNDKTLDMLAAEALSHARAGADMLAPSDMMDGRIQAIRAALDENGFSDIPLMSYAVKYASAFYGPFRDAAQSTPSFGDRRAYQMDPANGLEGIREAALDINEGADIIMVKPALPYLDVIRGLKESFDHPVAAYHVSGEYSMVVAAAEKGWLDFDRTMEECLMSMRRAGADIIISYYTKRFATRLKDKR